MNVHLLISALPICAYVLGSIPFGLLIVRAVARTDVRRIGSRNIGATNVKRAVGTKWALVTLLCDGLKGLLPTLVATWTAGPADLWLPSLTALAAITGHIYPLFLAGKPSGKGVATALGCLLAIAPAAAAICVSGFIAAIIISKRVSAGSLTAAVILPPSAWFTTHEPAIGVASLLIMALILFRHKDNIQRLAKGKEPALRNKLKDSSNVTEQEKDATEKRNDA